MKETLYRVVTDGQAESKPCGHFFPLGAVVRCVERRIGVSVYQLVYAAPEGRAQHQYLRDRDVEEIRHD